MKGRQEKKEVEAKQCNQCKKEKRLTHYYNSNSTLSDGKAPICKDCIKSMIDYNDINTIYSILRTLDIAFDIEYWEKAKESDKDPFGNYMRMANSLRQFNGLTWDDSVFEKQIDINATSSSDESNLGVDAPFRITQEMIIRWGSSHEKEDYLRLEDFYNKMKDTNRIETPQEEEYLKKLAVISLKMDKELKADRYNQAKQLGDLFSKYMADAKFRAMDRTEADKTGGIRTFGAIYAEVEREDHIPPWEYYRKIKGLKQDIVDKTIMHIENFTLRLNKIERMIEPPLDTPKLTAEDTDAFDSDAL